MPEAAQDLDGNVQISLGAKGIAELELVASGEKWGRGPSKDVHSSNRARLDSPAWHLVQALNTLIDENGDPAIDGYMEGVRPLSAAEAKMLDDAALRIDENTAKKSMGVKQWARNCELAAGARGSRGPPDGEHRRTGRRLHGAGRHDDPAASRGREARSAARARHDAQGRSREAQGASREARLRRHRGQRHGRLRSEHDAGGRAADQGRSRRSIAPPGSSRSTGRVAAAPGRATCSRASR